MNRRQLLYADNDEKFLDTRCEFLEAKGYEVVKARNPAEAEDILEQGAVHLALLDIRLADDRDDNDTSGILLAKDKRFERIPKILVTGFPTVDALMETYSSLMGGKPFAYAFLRKTDGLMPMLEAIESAFEKVICINFDQAAAWDDPATSGFSDLMLRMRGPLERAALARHASELQDLFGKLFFTASQLSGFRVHWARDGCACLSLFALTGNSSQQAIVVVGPCDAAKQYQAQAGQYTAVGFPPLPRPVYAETFHYGGVAFLLPQPTGDPVRDGPAFFRESGEKSNRAALENLFRRTLHDWHQRDWSEAEQSDVAAFYREETALPAEHQLPEALHAWASRLAESAQSYSLLKDMEFERGELKITFNNGELFRGPNPIDALLDAGAFAPLPSVLGSTLGGIRTDSLLIDDAERVYPTEFRLCSGRPVLEDYVSVESSFHFELLRHGNLLTLWDFEKQLGSARTLNDALQVGNVEPEYRKSMAAIQVIRKLAAEAAGEALLPYLVGLFHYALRDLPPVQAGPLLTRHEAAALVHRLLSASILLDQTRQPSGDDPKGARARPEELGLKIIEGRRQVLLDGRDVHLTEQEFDLLLYLSKTPGEVRNREDILSHVFDIKDADFERYNGQLNTTMDRLRDKIDPNPEKHRYIVTVRGVGYRLDLKP